MSYARVVDVLDCRLPYYSGAVRSALGSEITCVCLPSCSYIFPLGCNNDNMTLSVDRTKYGAGTTKRKSDNTRRVFKQIQDDNMIHHAAGRLVPLRTRDCPVVGLLSQERWGESF